MANVSQEERKRKLDLFCEAYTGVAKGNGSEAARIAGYSENSASKRAYELLQDPYVQDKLKLTQTIQREQLTDSVGSLDDIFEISSPAILKNLAERAKTDSNAANKFIDLKFKHDRQKDEDLGEYAGLSTAEIIRTIDTLVKEIEVLKTDLMATHGVREMQEEPDLPSIDGAGE